MRILTAIVTHNRRALLSRCLDHVQSQSRPTDGLIVINNGSTDGTEAMLRQRNVDVISQPNVGSAGGWFRAISHCQQHGYDAVWLMDDDGYPASNSLQLLEDSLTSDVACVSSVVVQESRPNLFVFPFPVLDPLGLPSLFSFPRKIASLSSLRRRCTHDVYPFVHLFNGALISSATINHIGNVNPAYFIAGDEVDYFYRMRKSGKVFTLLTSLHYHPDVSSRPFSAVKTYYYIRNTFILNHLYCDKALIRSLFSLIVVLLRIAHRNGPLQALSYILGPKLSVLTRAISSGLSRRLSHDYNG